MGLDGPHGPSAKLYVWDGSGTPVAAAEGVVEFGIAENFVAYGKDEAVWIYVFENGKSYGSRRSAKIPSFSAFRAVM